MAGVWERENRAIGCHAFTVSGLGLGMTTVNVLFLTVIVGLIAYLSIIQKTRGSFVGRRGETSVEAQRL